MSKAAARERAIELLDAVGIPSPRSRIDSYPHEFSGGMRQRVMIAMAMALRPAVLVADEPTTALDVTVQAQVLDVMRGVQQEFGTAIVLITHDLGVVADMADDVVVMYGGQVMERAPRRELFYRRHHPYTEGLLALAADGRAPRAAHPDRRHAAQPDHAAAGLPVRTALPVRVRRVRRDAACSGRSAPGTRRRAGCPVEPLTANVRRYRTAAALLEVADVCKYFPIGRRRLFGAAPPSLRAVDGVSLSVERGETLGLVGETGCGKSTLARCMTRLHDLTGGPRHVRRHRHQHAVARRAAPAAPRDAGDVPGPVRLAEPAPARRVDHRRPVRHPRRRRRRGAQAPGAGADGARGPQPRALQPLPGRVLRRPAPAHRHRQGVGAQAEARGVRRAGVGVGRVDPGADHQPARGAAGAAAAHLRVHHARPLGGAARQRPDRGHVPRQDRRGRGDRGPARAHPPPLHAARCSPPCPSRTRTRSRAASGSCCAATCPRPPRRRRAAGSTRAAPRRRSSASPTTPSWPSTRPGTAWRATSRSPTASCSRCRSPRSTTSPPT